MNINEPAVVPPSLDLPVLAVPHAVVYPVLALPLSVQSPRGVAAVEAALATEGRYVGVLSQRDGNADEPHPRNMYEVGTQARILNSFRTGDGIDLIYQGIARIRVTAWGDTDTHLQARFEPVAERPTATPDEEALMDTLRQLAARTVQVFPSTPEQSLSFFQSIDHPGVLADIVAANLHAPQAVKQNVLETFDIHERLEMVVALLDDEIRAR